MSIPNNKGVVSSADRQNFDPRLIARVMTVPARRKLLIALATCGPKTAGELTHVGKGDGLRTAPGAHVESTAKNLVLMVEAGIVVEQANPCDGRRTIYCLSPEVKVTREGDLTVFDFGSRVARLDADGN